jgi:AcrR family transcriptional regulator
VTIRARILDAALGLLAEGADLTQPRVAKAAGIRQSHLTYYFPTVTDLMQAVARHSFESLGRELGGRGAGGIAAATLDKRRVRLMLSLVLAADRDASLKPRMRAFVREIRGRIAPLLELEGSDLAFLHTVVVGAAVLQLARDNAEARREARAVIDKAIRCIARR